LVLFTAAFPSMAQRGSGRGEGEETAGGM